MTNKETYLTSIYLVKQSKFLLFSFQIKNKKMAKERKKQKRVMEIIDQNRKFY